MDWMYKANIKSIKNERGKKMQKIEAQVSKTKGFDENGAKM